MEITQKSLGLWLIFSGIICFIVSIIVYNLLIFFLSVFLEFYWVIILLSLAGIASTIIGGIKIKYNVASWIILSGVIMIMGSIILASLFMSLGGILLSYTSIIPILIVIGLICIVVAALINEK